MTYRITASEAKKISSGNRIPIVKLLLSQFDIETTQGINSADEKLEEIFSKIIEQTSKFQYELKYSVYSRLSTAALEVKKQYYRSLINTIVIELQKLGYRVDQHSRKSNEDGTDAIYFYETNCLDITVGWR